MTDHVIYLVYINGRPAAWAPDRASADRIAETLRLRDEERSTKKNYIDRQQMTYYVGGVTDSPYGDPDADTEQRVGTRYVQVMNGLAEIIDRIHSSGGYMTAMSLVNELEALCR